LELRPHTLRQALVGVFFHAGAHGCSTLLAGLIYRALGGTIPVTTLEPRLWAPFVAMFVANVIIHELLLVGRVYWSGNILDLRKISEAMPALIFGEVFSLPLALLLPISYYMLSPAAFLLLVGGAIMAAVLFRAAERSRWALERRIVELATLNSVGQSLTSSLNMPDLMQSVYDQVARLMEVNVFYIALYDAESQGVTFPFMIRDGVRTNWPTR